MIELTEAYTKAKAAVLDPAPYDAIVEAYESPTEWIFCPGNPDDEDDGIEGGCFPIAVSKTSGKATTINLPSSDGFSRMEAATEIPIPA